MGRPILLRWRQEEDWRIGIERLLNKQLVVRGARLWGLLVYSGRTLCTYILYIYREKKQYVFNHRKPHWSLIVALEYIYGTCATGSPFKHVATMAAVTYQCKRQLEIRYNYRAYSYNHIPFMPEHKHQFPSEINPKLNSPVDHFQLTRVFILVPLSPLRNYSHYPHFRDVSNDVITGFRYILQCFS